MTRKGNYKQVVLTPPRTSQGFLEHMCHGQKSRFIGDKLIPPLKTESLFHGALLNPDPDLG